ncbi:MAG: MFS transporter, partial [Pseudobdellovibrio sp.]
RAKNSEQKHKKFEHLFRYFHMPVVAPLITAFALATLSMSMMEATLVLYMKDKFNWDIKEVSFGFAYIGIIIVFTQGFLVRRLIPKLGERNVLRIGLVLLGCGLIGIGFSSTIPMMGVVMTLLSLGHGLTNPSFLGSVSLLVPSEEQGLALGTTQSLSALGRVFGPMIAGLLFEKLSMSSPFIAGGLFTALAFVMIISIYSKLPTSGQKTTSLG